MPETQFDEGVPEEYTMGEKRITFKLNNKTYAAFNNSDIGKDVQNFMIQHQGKKINIAYFDNEKDGTVYHNITKIDLAEDQTPQEEPVVEASEGTPTPQPKPIASDKGQIEKIEGTWNDQRQKEIQLGQAMNQALKLLIHRDNKLNTMEGWDEYVSLVKQFFATNKKIREEVFYNG